MKNQSLIITLVIAILIVLGLSIGICASVCSRPNLAYSTPVTYTLDTIRCVDLDPDTIIRYDTTRFYGIDDIIVDTIVSIYTYAPESLTKENWEESYKADVKFYSDNKNYANATTEEALFNKYFVVVRRYSDGTIKPDLQYRHNSRFDIWKETTISYIDYSKNHKRI